MEPREERMEFHLDRIDETLAEIFLLFGGRFRVRMEILPGTRAVRAVFSPCSRTADFPEAVDFELSSCERGDGEETDPEERVGVPFRTSSALEFFDSVFSRRRGLSCDVDFVSDSWTIAVAGYG